MERKPTKYCVGLKGRLYLIRGNHDERYLRDKDFDVSRFEWVRDYAEIHDNKQKNRADALSGVLLQRPVSAWGRWNTADLHAAWAYPQVGRSGAGGSVRHRDQSHDAEKCPSGNSAAGAVPDDQLLLYVFGLHATHTGRVGGSVTKDGATKLIVANAGNGN